MQLKTWLVASLAGLAASAKVGETYKEQTCFTAQGAKSLKVVPTTTSTHKQTYTIHKTKYHQSVVTITPKTVVRTAKKTTVITVGTAIWPVTHTINVVSTKYTTVKTTPTVTQTSTTTITAETTITATNIVPTPSGFRPIGDTLHKAVYNDLPPDPQAKRDNVIRSVHNPKDPQKRDQKQPPTKEKPMYPQKVKCDVTTFIPKVVTATREKPATTVTANYPAKTITKTQTITSTKTRVPDYATIMVQSTVTFTISSTATAKTITTTSTLIIPTATVTVPGPTVYDMCTKRNLANTRSYRGSFLGRTSIYSPADFSWHPLFQSTTVDVKDAFECCSLCAADEACIGFQMRPVLQCQILKPGPSVCTPAEPCVGRVTWFIDYNDPYAVLGNGPGLQWTEYDVETAQDDA